MTTSQIEHKQKKGGDQVKRIIVLPFLYNLWKLWKATNVWPSIGTTKENMIYGSSGGRCRTRTRVSLCTTRSTVVTLAMEVAEEFENYHNHVFTPIKSNFSLLKRHRTTPKKLAYEAVLLSLRSSKLKALIPFVSLHKNCVCNWF